MSPAAAASEPSLVDKLLALHAALDAGSIPHGFGGALALAWCTERARGTVDIDLNVFMPVDRADSVLEALPGEVSATEHDRAAIARDGQVRLWWSSTPVDLFWSTTEFHDAAAERCRIETFAGARVPFLGCDDLAVFKAFFDRSKDWVDLEEMNRAGSLDVDRVLGVLLRYLGPGDARVARLIDLTRPEDPTTRSP